MRHRTGLTAGWLLVAALGAGCDDTETTDKDDNDIDASELGGVGSTAGGDDGGGEPGGEDGGGGTGGTTVTGDLATTFTEGAWTLNHYDLPWEVGGELGYLVVELLPQQPVFGGGVLGAGSSVTLQAGLLDERGESQDTCVPTDTLTGTLDSDGTLTIETPLATLPIYTYGIEIHLVDASFRGTLDAETGALEALAMSATWDARLDAPSFGSIVGTDSPDELCSLIASFGARCDGCADGEFYCVDVAFGDTDTRQVEGAVVAVEEGCR
jgi:hypothetical protein